MDKVSKVKEIWKTVADSLTKEEFLAAFKKATDILTKMEIRLIKKIDDRLAQIRDGRDGKDGKDGRNIKGDKGDGGEKGDKGDRGDDGKDGTDGSPDSAYDIRNKLELLEGNDRLKAEAISGLTEFIQSLPKEEQQKIFHTVSSTHALWALMDVSIAGIIAGQSLQWDGIKWIAFTPAGSGGTPIWGEVLQTQSPTGTSFTLAHTPITGSVRLFRGGSYQSVSNGDYTLVGATITLSTALQSGETLVADYSY